MSGNAKCSGNEGEQHRWWKREAPGAATPLALTPAVYTPTEETFVGARWECLLYAQQSDRLFLWRSLIRVIRVYEDDKWVTAPSPASWRREEPLHQSSQELLLTGEKRRNGNLCRGENPYKLGWWWVGESPALGPELQPPSASYNLF